MAVTEGKKKKPPTFHYLPRSRAKQLKKAWIEDHKIRSKWKLQKKREGLTSQSNKTIEDAAKREHDESKADSQSDAVPPPCDKPTLRDLRKIAYTRQPPHKLGKVPECSRSGNGALERKKAQPNMKLRMDVLLEKIKRDA